MGLLEKLKAGSENYKETVWPGTDYIILLRVLSAHDQNNVTFETEKLFTNNKVSVGVGTIDDYNAERETRMLFYSITDPETRTQSFKNITEFRKVLTPEIKEILAEELNELHEECSPSPYEIDQAEFDKLVVNIKKNVEETVGSVSNIHTLRKLVIYLASPPVI
jgi:predicted transcriptional regulator